MASVSHVSRGRQYTLLVDDDDVPVAAPAAAPVVRSVPFEPIAVREVCGFPARLLGALPDGSTLVCEHIDVGRVVVTTSQVIHTAAVDKWPTFTGRELAALALAAEHERASSEAFAVWCERKRAARTWRLSADEALGPVTGTFEPRGWAIGRVLGWYAVRVVAVGVGDEWPEPEVTRG